jgi:hypothetical protein
VHVLQSLFEKDLGALVITPPEEGLADLPVQQGALHRVPPVAECPLIGCHGLLILGDRLGVGRHLLGPVGGAEQILLRAWPLLRLSEVERQHPAHLVPAPGEQALECCADPTV